MQLRQHILHRRRRWPLSTRIVAAYSEEGFTLDPENEFEMRREVVVSRIVDVRIDMQQLKMAADTTNR